MKKTKLIIIAGPQSSGKTTAFQFLKKIRPDFLYIPETNMYSIISKSHRGAAYVTKTNERIILKNDIGIHRTIPGNIAAAVIETGIFHLIYAEAILGLKQATKYYQQYCSALKEFNPVIIFIDTKPEVSWKRRKSTYEKRTANMNNPKERKNAMKKYKQTMFRFYPVWIKWYERFRFKKYMIRNSLQSKKVFLESIQIISEEYL